MKKVIILIIFMTQSNKKLKYEDFNIQ